MHHIKWVIMMSSSGNGGPNYVFNKKSCVWVLLTPERVFSGDVTFDTEDEASKRAQSLIVGPGPVVSVVSLHITDSDFTVDRITDGDSTVEQEPLKERRVDADQSTQMSARQRKIDENLTRYEIVWSDLLNEVKSIESCLCREAVTSISIDDFHRLKLKRVKRRVKRMDKILKKTSKLISYEEHEQSILVESIPAPKHNGD